MVCLLSCCGFSDFGILLPFRVMTLLLADFWCVLSTHRLFSGLGFWSLWVILEFVDFYVVWFYLCLLGLCLVFGVGLLT